MVKSVISVIVATALIAVGATIENIALRKTFDELIVMNDLIVKKLDNDTATSQDILSLQTFWHEKKRSLHVYVPHTELKELDLWIAEAVTYVKYGKNDEAIAKLVVVKKLCEQIPKTFSLKIENLF